MFFPECSRMCSPAECQHGRCLSSGPTFWSENACPGRFYSGGGKASNAHSVVWLGVKGLARNATLLACSTQSRRMSCPRRQRGVGSCGTSSAIQTWRGIALYSEVCCCALRCAVEASRLVFHTCASPLSIWCNFPWFFHGNMWWDFHWFSSVSHIFLIAIHC